MELYILIWLVFAAIMTVATALMCKAEIGISAHFKCWVYFPLWFPVMLLITALIPVFSEEKLHLKEFFKYSYQSLFPNTQDEQ